MEREAEQQRIANVKSEQEKEVLFAKVFVDDALEEVEEMDCDREISDDSDTDWDDFEDWENKLEYNTLKLKNFARECDRYKASNREGAKLANTLLKDLNIVTKDDTSMLD